MSRTASTEMSTRPGFPGLKLVADLGGTASLAVEAMTAPFRRRGDAPPLLGATIRQASWLIAAGFPIVGLTHLSIGSFLAMQSFYGATFSEAAGPVVGLGLIRNVAPLLTGFIVAGLIAAKVTTELRGGPRPGLDDDPASVPDREASQGLRPDDRPKADAGRLVFARIAGAALAGPVLTMVGSAVGSCMGMLVAKTMLGLRASIFIGKFMEMLLPCDVAGIVVKGSAFAGCAALVASFEGLRPLDAGCEPNPHRAAVRAIFLILLMNLSWFNVIYLAGKPYGPLVVAAPAG